MASINRHRYGDPKVATIPVLAASVIEIGDLCWYDSSTDTVKRASDYVGAGDTGVDATDLITTQTAFKKVFCGVARSAKRSTDPAGTIQVDTSGVFEFPCTTIAGTAAAAATYDLGTFLAPAATSVKDYTLAGVLSNQLLAPVAAATSAIGKPARVTTAALTAYAALESTVHNPDGGVQTVT